MTVNQVEKMFLEQMQEDVFHQTVNDNFDFVDSLIEQSDLDKVSDKEGEDNASDD